MRTSRLTLDVAATLALLGGMSGAVTALDEATDHTATTPAEPGYPILEIVDVEVEPVPWVREQVSKTSPQGVCDFFRIRLTFTISNHGTADFPPAGIPARLDTGGKLFWTVLFGGDETQQPRETGQATIYNEYSFWYHDELTIPEGGVAKVVREFAAPTDVPLNDLTVVAWFVPPMTEYLADGDGREPSSKVKSGRTSRDAPRSSAPARPTMLLRPSPPPDAAPPIRQTITRDGREQVALELMGAPFRSTPITISGPDLLPLQAIWVKDDKPEHWNTVLVFENRGSETVASVRAGMGVSYVGTTESMGWSLELPGPFPRGRFCAYVLGEHALLEPDFSTNRAQVSLRCPLPEAVGADTISLSDVDPTNDRQEFPDTRERSGYGSLREVTGECDVRLYLDPDR
jgi:hypothetical protein